jgi:hypothetical protein
MGISTLASRSPEAAGHIRRRPEFEAAGYIERIMNFLLILGSIMTLAGVATIAFARPLAAKMRRDEARWGDQGVSTRTFMQTPGRMRAYGVLILLFAATLFVRALT